MNLNHLELLIQLDICHATTTTIGTLRLVSTALANNVGEALVLGNLLQQGQQVSSLLLGVTVRTPRHTMIINTLFQDGNAWPHTLIYTYK